MKKIYVAVPALLAAYPAAAQSLDLSSQLAEGGTALLVTLGLSILALAVMMERFLHLRRAKLIPEGLAEEGKALWSAGDLAGLEARLADNDSTLARVMRYMVQHRHADYAVIGAGAADIASMAMRRHQQKAYPLTIVATVAPIVGLLGTVVGMIEAFHVIASADGMGNPALLASGISKALINTAAGLSVALPALGMHHFFRNRTIFLSLDLEQEINQLMEAWFMPRHTIATTVMPAQVQRHAH